MNFISEKCDTYVFIEHMLLNFHIHWTEPYIHTPSVHMQGQCHIKVTSDKTWCRVHETGLQVKVTKKELVRSKNSRFILGIQFTLFCILSHSSWITDHEYYGL